MLDILSCLIYKGVEGGIIDSFKVGSKEVALSQLQFADDTIFFYSGKEDLFFILNHILGFFEGM